MGVEPSLTWRRKNSYLSSCFFFSFLFIVALFGVGLRRKDDELHLARCLTERERRGGRGYKEENEEEEEKKLSRRVYITVEQLMKDSRCVGEPQPFCCFFSSWNVIVFFRFYPS